MLTSILNALKMEIKVDKYGNIYYSSCSHYRTDNYLYRIAVSGATGDEYINSNMSMVTMLIVLVEQLLGKAGSGVL